MKLAQLLSVFPQLKWGETATEEVLDLTQDSRQVKRGSVFVAVRGHASDGHAYLATAANNGAIALVLEDEGEVPNNYNGAVVKVANARQALDVLATKFFGDPARDLFCVGVTGTNGKTTITYMLEAIFTRFGWPTGVMG